MNYMGPYHPQPPVCHTCGRPHDNCPECHRPIQPLINPNTSFILPTGQHPWDRNGYLHHNDRPNPESDLGLMHALQTARGLPTCP